MRSSRPCRFLLVADLPQRGLYLGEQPNAQDGSCQSAKTGPSGTSSDMRIVPMRALPTPLFFQSFFPGHYQVHNRKRSGPTPRPIPVEFGAPAFLHVASTLDECRKGQLLILVDRVRLIPLWQTKTQAHSPATPFSRLVDAVVGRFSAKRSQLQLFLA